MINIEVIIILALIAFIVGLIIGVILTRPSTNFSGYFRENPKDLPHPKRNSAIRKEITWQLISNTLVSQVPNNKDLVQVLYNGDVIDDARLVTIKIWNTGNIPILPQDYENDNPIVVNLGEETVVLDAEILDANPSNLKETAKAVLNWNAGRILLGPILLNSLDSITLKLLLAHFAGELVMNTEIAGVKQKRLHTS